MQNKEMVVHPNHLQGEKTMYKFLKLILIVAMLSTWYALNFKIAYKVFSYGTILGLTLTLILLVVNIGVLEAIKKEIEKNKK